MDNLRLLCLVVNVCRETARQKLCHVCIGCPDAGGGAQALCGNIWIIDTRMQQQNFIVPLPVHASGSSDMFSKTTVTSERFE